MTDRTNAPAISSRQYLLPALALAAAGAGVCVVAVAGFVASVATNNLPWHPGLTVQEHYLEIGRSYSQGFVAGFFLCFFLTLAAVVVSSWWERKKAHLPRPAGQPETAGP